VPGIRLLSLAAFAILSPGCGLRLFQSGSAGFGKNIFLCHILIFTSRQIFYY